MNMPNLPTLSQSINLARRLVAKIRHPRFIHGALFALLCTAMLYTPTLATDPYAINEHFQRSTCNALCDPKELATKPKPKSVSDQGKPTELFWTIKLPMSDGKLALGQLLGALANKVGVDGDNVAKHIKVNIKVDGVVGRLTLKTIEKATKKIVTLEVQEENGKHVMAIKIDRIAIRRQKQFIRNRVVRLIESWYPKAAAKAKARYGLWVYDESNKLSAFSEFENPKEHAVVLIHGLDEPGDVWAATGPALMRSGFFTMEYRYPNDQRINKSARAFARQMVALKQAGVSRITIVAHSMGGLVTREMLTHEDFYAGKGTNHETYPDVARLIMVGTPNKGSSLVRLRGAAEARETIIRLFSRDRMLFGGFFDGTGEAAVDLLPDSEFLKRLNARPLANNVKHTILAGRASPVTVQRITELTTQLKIKLPDEHDAKLNWITEVLTKVVEGVGDGCVSLASTKLAGVDDHVLVRGNHANMLDRTVPDSQGIPAAIDEIVKRLKIDHK